MNVGDRHYRTVWIEPGGNARGVVRIIDQRKLPFAFEIEELRSLSDAAVAIRDMHVRGAGCIGATAAFGIYLAACEAIDSNQWEDELNRAGDLLKATRPTAVNLAWAVDRQRKAMARGKTPGEKLALARETAQAIADEDVDCCRRIGEHGLELLKGIAAGKTGGEPVNILTHCNAGWLAFVDYGSATAPIYAAHAAGIPVHVWVDETRPRNQGARLTAWELREEGIPHTVVADNAGGHLMQSGRVDVMITGTDRTTGTGDVANKIGTYLKALAARDNGVPFYVALPSSSFDWAARDGVREIPIEERGGEEILRIEGRIAGEDRVVEVCLAPEGTAAANYAFDVTPARLVTGLITERGICEATEAGIGGLFPR